MQVATVKLITRWDFMQIKSHRGILITSYIATRPFFRRWAYRQHKFRRKEVYIKFVAEIKPRLKNIRSFGPVSFPLLLLPVMQYSFAYR